MLGERPIVRRSDGRGLVELRGANWFLACRAVQELGDDWDWAETEFEFLCECGRCGCSTTLELAISTYVMAASRRCLVLASGHQSPLDDVEERTEHYVVIRSEGSRRPTFGEGDGHSLRARPNLAHAGRFVLAVAAIAVRAAYAIYIATIAPCRRGRVRQRNKDHLSRRSTHRMALRSRGIVACTRPEPR
jgi:hypothetical protein